MAIVIEDTQMENMAKQIAITEGITVTEVLRESLHSLARTRGLIVHKAPFRERLAELAREIDSMPTRVPHNSSSDDCILGYNEHGVW